jgi:hypothetical protein
MDASLYAYMFYSIPFDYVKCHVYYYAELAEGRISMARKKAPEESKRFPLNMRTTKEMRKRLEDGAARSGRSLIQEVEGRLEDSFKDDPISRSETLTDLHELIRRYLRQLGGRGDFNFPDDADALRVGLNLIVDAAATTPTPLSEERVRQFWMTEIPALGKAANIANEALNVLSVAGLAHLDPLKLSEWIRAEKRD